MFKIKHLISTAALLAATTINAEMSDIVDIHGFVSQGLLVSNKNTFLADNSRDGSLELREVGINFQKEVGNRIRVGAQILSRDVGVYGNNKVVLDWAYGEFKIHDMLRLSAGRVKNQLGFYTDVQDFDFLTPWALLPSYFYNKGLRSLSANTDGIKVSGNIDIKKGGSFDYSFTYGFIDLGKETDIEAYGKTLGVELTNTSLKSTFVTHLMYNAPIDGLKLNLSHVFLNKLSYKDVPKGTNPFNGNTITADAIQNNHWFFAGVQYQHSYFDIIAEYHLRYAKGEITVNNMPISPTIQSMTVEMASDTASRHGGYIGANIKPVDWFNFGGYYQMYWHDTHISDNEGGNTNPVITEVGETSNINNDAAITASFNILGNFVIKLEGHFVKGTAMLSAEQNPEGLKDTWQYGVAKLTYNF